MYVALLAKFTLKIPALVAYCTALLSLAGPWLWYRFFRELQSSKTLALAGWACLSFLPSWIAIYGYFMQETLMLPLLGAALALVEHSREAASRACGSAVPVLLHGGGAAELHAHLPDAVCAQGLVLEGLARWARPSGAGG